MLTSTQALYSFPKKWLKHLSSFITNIKNENKLEINYLVVNIYSRAFKNAISKAQSYVVEASLELSRIQLLNIRILIKLK